MTVTSGAMVLTWNPSTRLLEQRFESAGRAAGPHGAALVDLLTQVIGSERQPFAVLADAANVSGVDAEYRALAGRFFRQHRDEGLIAISHMGAIVRVTCEMFRIVTGVRLKGFAEEADARAWLQENGIRA